MGSWHTKSKRNSVARTTTVFDSFSGAGFIEEFNWFNLFFNAFCDALSSRYLFIEWICESGIYLDRAKGNMG